MEESEEVELKWANQVISFKSIKHFNLTHFLSRWKLEEQRHKKYKYTIFHLICAMQTYLSIIIIISQTFRRPWSPTYTNYHSGCPMPNVDGDPLVIRSIANTAFPKEWIQSIVETGVLMLRQQGHSHSPQIPSDRYID